MREEKLFSKDGGYTLVVESNALFHKEAVIHGIKTIEPLMQQHPAGETIRVLDLACGAEPVSICQMLAHFPAQRISYTGIDINPDQVGFARQQFHFPDNIIETSLIEGNAWDPSAYTGDAQYDIIFMGLNLHHGTPEEVYYLAGQIDKLLAPHGLYINHDVYRPDSEPYQRRPSHNPDDASESFALLSPELLTDVDLSEITGKETSSDVGLNPWRSAYSQLLRDSLIEKGAGQKCAESTYRHAASRDYPISVADFRYIFQRVNPDFSIEVIRYGNSHPFLDYIAMPVVRRVA